MNSAQRRKNKREHPYCISINISHNEQHFDYVDRVNLAIAWCKKKSTSGYVITTAANRYRSVFKFAERKEAVFFGLKFL